MNYRFLLAAILLISCQGMSVPQTVTASQDALTNEQASLRGLTHFYFDEWAGKQFSVWLYVPDDVNLKTAPIMVMMHGAKRGAARYLSEWDQVADENGFIVIAPEFDRDNFPGSSSYNRGNVFADRELNENDPAIWTFSAIEPVFKTVTEMLGSEQSTFTLYGHSAGSQFSHRFMQFMPDVPVKRFMFANAGWYTFADIDTPYPYGLKGTRAASDANLKRILQADVVVLLGDKDNDPAHSSLRRSDGANAQGAHRFARGQSFYASAKLKAEELGVDFGWQLRIVPGIAHSNGGIAAAAGDLVE